MERRLNNERPDIDLDVSWAILTLSMSTTQFSCGKLRSCHGKSWAMQYLFPLSLGSFCSPAFLTLQTIIAAGCFVVDVYKSFGLWSPSLLIIQTVWMKSLLMNQTGRTHSIFTWITCCYDTDNTLYNKTQNSNLPQTLH